MLTGLASGLGSLGLYYMMARRTKLAGPAKTEMTKFASEADEREDEEQIAGLLRELKRELTTYPSEPEFCLDEQGLTDFTFTKEFMLKLNYITSKYQIIMQQAIKNQQQHRRDAAIEARDDTAFAKAFFDYTRRLNLVTTIVHDTIFDYFGISTQQIEISGAKNDKDMDFKLKMLRQAQDLLQEFEAEESTA